MAHNLETNGNDVAFALRGTPAWHNLANRIFSQDEEVSTQLMLDEAKLSNWDVRLSPIADHIPTEWNDSSGAQYVLRTNPFNSGTDVLSVVGSRYKVAITPVRVVCQNTLNLAMRNAKQSFKIRHTQTAEGKIQIARETLGLTLGYFDAFEKEAQDLFKQSITDKQFSELIRTIYPKPEEKSKLALTKWENKVVLIDDLYFNSPTNTNIKGTKWGAFNALTEHLDYFRPTRSANNSESKWAAASGFDPIITAQKNKILQVVKSA